MDKCKEEFEETFKKLNKISLSDHAVIFGYPKREEAFFNAAWQEQQKRIDELQARVDAASKETQHALRYVEADMRGNHEFLKMAMIRTFKSLAQALKGGEV